MIISKDYFDFLHARIESLEADNKQLTNAMFMQGGLRAPYEVPVDLPKPKGRVSWDQKRARLERDETLGVK